MLHRIVILVILAALRTAAVLAQQPARHVERLGTVRFPTSCAPTVGVEMNRGVALLHSFEFGAALRSFDLMLAADSGCAMAQWGRALALWSNPMSVAGRPSGQLARGRDAADAARRLAVRATERERGYAEAVGLLYDDYEHVPQRTRVLAYERGMAALVAAQPADTEARIFHALALVAAADPRDTTHADLVRVGAELEQLWSAQPDHPGLAHYIIHAYDVPRLASYATAAADRYAEIAPSAAHALHMPSHTFTRLGLWQASVDANRRSADVARREGSIAEALHAADYLVYAWLQERRLDSVRALLDGLPALAARFDPAAVTGAAPGAAGVFALAAMPARWTLERGAWAEAAALPAASTTVPYADAMTWFARALGGARGGRLAAAREGIDSLVAIAQRLRAQGEAYWAEQVEVQRLEAEAWLRTAERRRDDALALMREAAAREDRTEKSAVTPGPLVPARELLGDLLLALGRPVDALAAYRAALEREPNRYRALDGARRAAGATGDRPAAARYAAALDSLTSHQ